MKKNYLFWVALVVTTISFGQSIFINEIHYDNTGGDVGEGVEIVGPAGTDLTGYKVYLYNGNGSTYTPIKSLSGIIPNQQNNRGAIWFGVVLQNGSPDGLALVAPDGGTVLQFLSYEGVITAANGPALGMTSIDIGVLEIGATTPVGYSLQLTDDGWAMPMIATPNLPNTNQTTLSVIKNQIEGFALYPNPVLEGELLITSRSKENKQLEIYSQDGKRVYSKTVHNDETIDVTNLTTGFYFLKVEEEGKIATRKLIIK
tara:strand:+ start:49674 stop:50447 length:774 start_codon:yes stop_codon:yes gene_type:complete